ncbi:MAG: hypothetical protein R2861_12945 [Desulfobacterales bacterium]
MVASIETAGKDVIAEQDQARPADAPPLMEYSANLIGAQFGRRGVSESGGTWPRSGFSFWKGKTGCQLLLSPPAGGGAGGLIADSESLIFRAKSTARETPLRSTLHHNDYDLLQQVADDLKTELEKIPGVFDISDSYLPGKMEMQLKLKENAESLGLTLNDLARQVRHAFYGAEAFRFQRGTKMR